MPATTDSPTEIADPINARILAVSEDQLQGFQADPFADIARRSGVALDEVHTRLRAMLEAGTIRRIRQTLLANKLAEGALVAWKVPEEKLNAAFDWMHANDPFSGHAVIRSTDAETPGSKYRLWTTLKVPQGKSIEQHCDILQRIVGAEAWKAMPAKKLFALGVGHIRRRSLEIGAMADEPSQPIDTKVLPIADEHWPILEALKRELAIDEIGPDLWAKRAAEAGVSLETFVDVCGQFAERGILGRFSTFLEHHKRLATGERVTKFNALYHWRVPVGRELEAGGEVGRFHCMTHGYWREGGPEFANVNIMGVSHGTEKDRVLAHKAAIDEHLQSCGIGFDYTNVFWGGRSEIKPSEISPAVHDGWLAQYQ
ncbi:MAG: Lrp/AsnC family transcriptional regulator [Planctomycetota bacterium]